MALTLEEAQKVGTLVQRILGNTDKGLPPHTGIEVAELRDALALMRKDTSAAQSKSKASGVSAIGGGTAAPKIDITKLFTSAASTKPKQ